MSTEINEINKLRVNFDRMPIEGKNLHDNDSSIVLSIRDGFPRFVGFVNDGKKREGVQNMIFCTFTFKNIFLFLNSVISLTNMKVTEDTVIDGICMNTVYDSVNNKRTNEVYKQSAIRVKKSKAGIISITMVDGLDKDKKLTIPIKPDKWIKIIHNGKVITDTVEISNTIANILFTKYDAALTQVLSAHSVSKAKIIEPPKTVDSK